MKKIFILMAITLLSACNKDPNCKSSTTVSATGQEQASCGTTGTTTPTTNPSTPADTGSDGVIADKSFSTNVDLSSLSQTDADKTRRALALIVKVVKSQEFQNRVLNFKFNGATEFANNNGDTNVDVLNKIFEAEEIHVPGQNHVMEFEYDLYYTFSSTIGYGTPNDNVIHSNTKYFYSFTDAEVAGNLMHEWLHKLGYDHDYYATAQRPYSVPYAIGDLMVELASK